MGNRSDYFLIPSLTDYYWLEWLKLFQQLESLEPLSP
jgi:hypothetical protein